MKMTVRGRATHLTRKSLKAKQPLGQAGHDLLKDLMDRLTLSRDDYSIGRSAQRRDFALAVGPVAGIDLGLENGFRSGPAGALLEGQPAAPQAFARGGGEEELDLRAGEDDGPDVAAEHHRIVAAVSPLRRTQRLPDRTHAGHQREFGG